MNTQDKPTILYLFDPLCGWCYGFGPVISQLAEDYNNDFEFSVMGGGMITGRRVGPATAMASYIRGAYTRVEQLSGVTFGRPYLDDVLSDSSYMFNSVPPSLAVYAFKQLVPEKGIAFAHEVQKLQFVEGKNLNDMSIYSDIAVKLGAEKIAFDSLLAAPATQDSVHAEFAQVSAWGISGFPTVILIRGNQGTVLTQGYTDYKRLAATLDKNK